MIYSKIIYILHFISLIILLFSSIIFPHYTLKYQILIIPLTFLDWNDYDGQCILTRLEYYFRTGVWKQKSFEENGPEFFRPILEKIIGKKINRITASRINYVLFITSWIITYYKFLKYYKIKFN